MARLEFMFREFVDEISAISQLAARFIVPESSHVLPQLKTSLEGIRTSASGRKYPWGIPERSPLRTITSKGEYEAGDRRGVHHVFAEITSTWSLEALGPHNVASLPHRKFALTGIASTRVRLFTEEKNGRPEQLAMWRMEIADEASPGCYFHVQVRGEEDRAPFPKSLSIPRLPSFFATPPSVLEFVLGELFQDEWRKEAVRESDSLKMWRPLQLRRFANLLGWQRKKLRDSQGSPWAALKSLQPHASLFTEDIAW